MLEGIRVDKAQITDDILAQVSPEVKQEFLSKFKGQLYAFPNANNRGYCRVIMSPDQLLFFASILDKLDNVNRSYMWRVLFDHVK